MSKKQRLELTWIGKDQQPKLEPRILIEDPEKSYGDKHTENKLIFGDNLLALKALEQDYSGKIKCIFIDPPYNTGSAFTHYDDGIEHSLWLGLMRDRLEILRRLLSEDGSLWVTLDDNEAHYFRVMADEVFGRKNFIASVIWRKNFSPKSSAKHFSVDHDYLMIYAKNEEIWRPNPMPRSAKQDKAYKNPSNDPRGPWTSGDLSARNYYSLGIYPITTPSGRVIEGPPPGTYWRVSYEKFKELNADNRIWWGKDGDGIPRLKRFLSEVKQGVVPQTYWSYEEVGHTQEAKKESVVLFGEDVFATPKPEKLLERIFSIASNQGELILDSFAGSGTSGAVAQKMGRKWIMVELGEHCNSHIIPRLQKVVDGTDQGGISQAVGWAGGGGFQYYSLAPSLLKQDPYGQWIIEETYNADMLAAAMAKQEGFRYQPDETVYWKQGQSTEKDFIFTTTHFVTVEFLDKLHEEIQPEESLLVCCKSFRKECEDRYPNITVKKIPKVLLGRCEFGRDDYSLNVINIPTEHDDDFLDEPEPEPVAAVAVKPKGRKAPKASNSQKQLSLMGE